MCFFDVQLDSLRKILRPTARDRRSAALKARLSARRHSEVLARAVGQVDGHRDKVVRRAAHGNVLAGRPFGGALRQSSAEISSAHRYNVSCSASA